MKRTIFTAALLCAALHSAPAAGSSTQAHDLKKVWATIQFSNPNGFGDNKHYFYYNGASYLGILEHFCTEVVTINKDAFQINLMSINHGMHKHLAAFLIHTLIAIPGIPSVVKNPGLAALIVALEKQTSRDMD